MQKIAAIIFLLLFSFKTHSAGYAYGGLNYSFIVVISKNDAYNGATTLSPGLVAGVRFNKIGLEVFGRKFTMVNDDYVVNNIQPSACRAKVSGRLQRPIPYTYKGICPEPNIQIQTEPRV